MITPLTYHTASSPQHDNKPNSTHHSLHHLQYRLRAVPPSRSSFQMANLRSTPQSVAVSTTTAAGTRQMRATRSATRSASVEPTRQTRATRSQSRQQDTTADASAANKPRRGGRRNDGRGEPGAGKYLDSAYLLVTRREPGLVLSLNCF